MVDIALSAKVSRTLLSLPDLELNDHADYYIGASFLGAAQDWNRNQVGSPFLDGQVTTYRTRQMVTEPVQIEVPADNQTELTAKMTALVQAFLQSDYTITVVVGGSVLQYQCEAADFQVLWTTPRLVEHQGQATFQVPRQPNPLVGGF